MNHRLEEERRCEHCDGIFHPWEQGASRYCSRRCYIAGQTKTRFSEPFLMGSEMVCEVIVAGRHTMLITAEDRALVESYSLGVRCAYVNAQPRDRSEKPCLLHRLIMDAPKWTGKGSLEVDHINGDKMDNRRSNLRLVTRSQNKQNVRGARRGSQTGVRNVAVTGNRFAVILNPPGKKHFIYGTFDTLDEAKRAAEEGRRLHYTHAPECYSQATPEAAS